MNEWQDDYKWPVEDFKWTEDADWSRQYQASYDKQGEKGLGLKKVWDRCQGKLWWMKIKGLSQNKQLKPVSVLTLTEGTLFVLAVAGCSTPTHSLALKKQ